MKSTACLILALFIVQLAKATSYTWNGATNTSWTTTTNWTPIGVPGNSDNVTIVSATNSPHLDSVRTISNLTMTSGTLDLDGFSLTVNGTATFNGGSVIDGYLKPRGTVTTFSGTNFSCKIDAVSGQIKFNGGVFNDSTLVDHNGASSSTGDGGCIFNAPLIIYKSGTGSTMRLGNLYPDTFNTTVTAYLNSTGALVFGYSADGTLFNGDLILNSSISTTGITVGNLNTNSITQLASGKTISIGSSGFGNTATLSLRNFTQLGNTSQSLALSSSAVLDLQGSVFNGALTYTGPNLVCKNSIFNGPVVITKNSNAANNWYGGNSFNSSLTINTYAGNNGVIRPEFSDGNIYIGDVILNSNDTGLIQMVYGDTSEFKSNLSINSVKVTFNNGSGIIKFSGDQEQNINGSTIQLDKFVLDKPGESIVLNTNLEIDSSFNFLNGYIVTDTTNLLIFKTGSIAINASINSFVSGPVKKIGNTAFTFPVGKSGLYMPIGMSAPSLVTDAFVAEYFLDSWINDGNLRSDSLSIVDAYNYWKLERKSGTASIEVTLYWKSPFAFDFFGRTRIARWNGSLWFDEGGTSVTGDVANGSIKTPSALSNLGYITFAADNSASIAPCSGGNGITPDTYYTFDVTNPVSNNTYVGYPYELYASDFTNAVDQAPTGTNYIDRPLSRTPTALSNAPPLPSPLSSISARVLSGGKINNYLNLSINSDLIYGSHNYQINLNNYIAVEMIFRLNEDFMDQKSMEFFKLGSSNAVLTEGRISFTTQSNNGGDPLHVDLDGTGRKSLSYYTDNEWHHIVFIYDGNIGRKEIWVDGELNEGFFKENTSLAASIIVPTGVSDAAFRINLASSADETRFKCDRDEIAIYVINRLCAEEIIEHYQNTLINGQHYNFSAWDNEIVVATSNDLTGNYDPLDYPLNYTFSNDNNACAECNVDVNNALVQLSNYPLPRYKPGNGLHKNVNWLQSEYLGYENDDINSTLAYQIQDEMALNWNYYYNLLNNFSNAHQIAATTPNPTSIKVIFDHAANDHVGLGYNFEYALLLHRRQIRFNYTSVLGINPVQGPIDNLAWIFTNQIPEPEKHYLSDYNKGEPLGGPNVFYTDQNQVASGPTDWSPASGVATYENDGILMGDYLEEILNNRFPYVSSSFPRKIGFIGENNEVTRPSQPTSLVIPGAFDHGDYIAQDKVTLEGSLGTLTWPEYQSYRKMELDNSYRDEIINRTSIQSRIADAPFLNYAVDGFEKYRYNYDYLIQTQKMPSSWATNPYTTPDFYVRAPRIWKLDADGAEDHGWLWLAKSRTVELQEGHNRFSPFVSSGWYLREESNVRPSQWLGLLKCASLLGVDFFIPFHVNLEPQIRQGKSFIHMAAMPSYAQAISSYYEDALISGTVMTGDREMYDEEGVIYSPSYSFKSNSPQHLVVVRDYNSANKFAISGTIQPISNIEGNAPKEGSATILLDNTTIEEYLTFNIRRQGSTYIYISPGTSGTSDPIFYQLDKWHEFGHPENWSKNISLEAEVMDNASMPGSTAIKTEGFIVDVGSPTRYDFSNANSYITYTSIPTTALEYHFKPHESDIASGTPADYYIWLKARTKNTSGSSGVQFQLCNAAGTPLQIFNISCINSEDWVWYNLDNCSINPVLFSGLTQEKYILKVLAQDEDLELDELILTRDKNFRKYPDQTGCALASCCISSSLVVNSGNNTSSSHGSGWSSMKVEITVDFTINSGSFTIDASNILISPGKKITINNGSSLTIANNTRVSSCSDMWNRIEVENGGILNIENSLIEDGITAVYCKSVGTVGVRNSTFDHNYVSLNFQPGDHSSSSIYGSNFLCSGGPVLKSPHEGKHANSYIYLRYANGVQIGDDSEAPNYFEGGKIGVLGVFSDLDISNCSFHNFQNFDSEYYKDFLGTIYGRAIYNGNLVNEVKIPDFPINQSSIEGVKISNSTVGIFFEDMGVKIEDCSLDRCATGVFSSNRRFPQTLEITNSSILNSLICIDVFNGSNLTVNIHNNSAFSVNSLQGSNVMSAIVRAIGFARKRTSPFSIYDNENMTTNGWYGIYLNTIPGARIYNNNIYMNRPNRDYFSGTQFGIRLEKSDAKVSCNSIVGNLPSQINGKVGFSAAYSRNSIYQDNISTLTEKAVEYLGDCNNSKLRGNTFNHHGYGVYIGDENISANGMPGDQRIFNNLAPGNLYQGESINGVFSNSALYRYDNSPNPQSITFEVNSTVGSNYYTPASNNANSPNAEINLVPVSNTPYETDNPCVPLFLDDNSYSDEKKLSDEEIAQDTIQDTPEEIALDAELKRKLYYELSRDPSKMDSSAILQGLYNEFKVTDQDVFYKVDSLILLISDSIAQEDSASRYAITDAALGLNDNIVPGNSPETNERLINDIVLKTALRDSFFLDSIQREVVTDIAMLCPYVDGPSVYTARALYWLIDNRFRFNDEEFCNSSSRNFFNSLPPTTFDNGGVKLILQPNPAKSIVEVLYYVDQDATISLYDVNGKPLISKTVYEQTNKTYIDLDNVASGMYIVLLQTENGILLRERLIIVK